MGDDKVTINTIEDEVSSKIANLISRHSEQWNDVDRLRVQRLYMKEFSCVLREMLPLIQPLVHQPFMEELPTPDLPHPDTSQVDTKEEEDGCKSLENAQINHEGALMAVCKKRKEYPAYVAGLMGKTVRLQRHTVEALKVCLPNRASLEIAEGAEELDKHVTTQVKEIQVPLTHTNHSIQSSTHTLTQLTEAVQVLHNNHTHPIEALMATLNDRSAL